MNRGPLSAFPYAVPRTTREGIGWPALPDTAAARLLAMQLQLEQSQWWPPELIQARQFAQLREVLLHAARTVPFYRSRLTAAGYRPGQSLTEKFWRSLPLITRLD